MVTSVISPVGKVTDKTDAQKRSNRRRLGRESYGYKGRMEARPCGWMQGEEWSHVWIDQGPRCLSCLGGCDGLTQRMIRWCDSICLESHSCSCCCCCGRSPELSLHQLSINQSNYRPCAQLRNTNSVASTQPISFQLSNCCWEIKRSCAGFCVWCVRIDHVGCCGSGALSFCLCSVRTLEKFQSLTKSVRNICMLSPPLPSP